MASGFSYTGGRSRCFAYWQEFSKCYAEADTPSQCRLQADDYLECLHHTKEVARAKTVKAEFIKQAEHQAKEGRKVADVLADGVIVSVGLIQRGKSTESPK
ncbi:hypothetical protein SERLA73DRAFT_175540 [Serpula lacrymans var. lacrymans S7.3]|uniref:NADH dehydrogenase [ubiquinone] iron-sulfur protein 5 n=2 Tax=Serpula lacrymans var. lacrymans TaxID=341189 RepID=F8PKE4_SERL3|nr:uncharacterized protein SERLADRAFT_458040 [Serpula lacrymans var. lacrymans S7.9]EGO03858.1 hypothetical protein SERLA73DRAFT_175540 [Serpula lacrymans var. lacrymans S7.3]EGO29783.1 hypothetical protein SERLADRAFT_458040 [Serpula lacrymans var. lacrymans S7.9]